MKHVLCSNGSWIDGNSLVHKRKLEVGFMTLSSAYIDLFIRGEKFGAGILWGKMSGYQLAAHMHHHCFFNSIFFAHLFQTQIWQLFTLFTRDLCCKNVHRDMPLSLLFLNVCCSSLQVMMAFAASPTRGLIVFAVVVTFVWKASGQSPNTTLNPFPEPSSTQYPPDQPLSSPPSDLPSTTPGSISRTCFCSRKQLNYNYLCVRLSVCLFVPLSVCD